MARNDDVSVEVVKVVADALADAMERVANAVGEAVRTATTPPDVPVDVPVDERAMAREMWERARALEDPTDSVPWLSEMGVGEARASMGPPLEDHPGQRDQVAPRVRGGEG